MQFARQLTNVTTLLDVDLLAGYSQCALVQIYVCSSLKPAADSNEHVVCLLYK